MSSISPSSYTIASTANSDVEGPMECKEVETSAPGKPSLGIRRDYGENVSKAFPGDGPVLLPVIHLDNPEQTVRNARIALSAGCNGVWLIYHNNMDFEELMRERREINSYEPWACKACTFFNERCVSECEICDTTNDDFTEMSTSDLINKIAQKRLAECFSKVRNEFPNAWIGVNPQGCHREEVMEWVVENCSSANGIWIDDAAIVTADVDKDTEKVSEWKSLEDQPEEAKKFWEQVQESRSNNSWDGLYFGGVAFKHCEKVHPRQDEEKPSDEALEVLDHTGAIASHFMDVVATSSTKTGALCSLGKLAAFERVRPLAVSGVSDDADGLEEYAKKANIFFAATRLQKQCFKHKKQDSCQESFTELDSERVNQWVSNARR